MEKGITVKEGVVEEDITGSLLHFNTLEGMTGETPSHGRRPDYNDREAVGYETVLQWVWQERLSLWKLLCVFK